MWTDSQVVIDLINSKKKQKIFVSNRQAEINATQGNITGHHIPTHLNPADHGTRGLKPTDSETQWLAAPSFLMSKSYQWPIKSSVIDTKSILKFASVCASQQSFSGPSVFDINRFSSWNKLLLTIAAVFSFFFTKLSSSWAKDQDSNGKHRKKRQHSISNDIKRARNYIIKSAQLKSFSETIEHLLQKRRLEAKKKLINFNPYLDQKHILRSRSRLEFVPTMELESRHPLILMATHPTVKLYLQHAHRICIHQGGQEFVKLFVQQCYHIIGIRQTLRSIAHHCFLCR